MEDAATLLLLPAAGKQQLLPMLLLLVLLLLQVTAIIECCELYGASLGKLLATRHALLQQLQQQLTTQLSEPYMHDNSTHTCAVSNSILNSPRNSTPAGAYQACSEVQLLQQATAGSEHNQESTQHVHQLQQQEYSAAAAAGADQLHPWQLLDQLASNLQREHVLRSMLKCFVWGRILDSIQFAKAAVYSHPLFPDVHAIVCVLHKREQQQQRQQQQGQAAAGLKAAGGSSAAQQQQQQQSRPEVQPCEQCQVQPQQPPQPQLLMPMAT
jgi:hypothetical protein